MKYIKTAAIVLVAVAACLEIAKHLFIMGA
jgi:hypothetical protein